MTQIHLPLPNYTGNDRLVQAIQAVMLATPGTEERIEAERRLEQLQQSLMQSVRNMLRP